MFEDTRGLLESVLAETGLTLYSSQRHLGEINSHFLRQFFIIEPGVCLKLVETRHVTRTLSTLKDKENTFINQVLEREGVTVVQVDIEEWGQFQKSLL